MGLDRRYLFLAALLILIVFGISMYMYPGWKGAWWLLIVAVVVGVVGFIANFRKAFEDKEDKPMNKEPEKKPEEKSNPGGVHIERSSAGGDIMAATGGGDVNKIGNQFNNPTININLPPVFRPGSAPPKPDLIIGRDDDIAELKIRLGTKKDDKISFQILTAIKGWPGVGKTTIASALAYDTDIVKQFPDGVLWTSLGQDPNIISDMAAWGRALGTSEILKAKTVEEAQSILAGILRNKRMLLIIDDVWKAEDAVPFKVGGASCATLITTRLDMVADALAPAADNIYRLKVLKDEDALELLRRLAPTVVAKHPKECMILVKELEGLPLALQVAGRLLNKEANRGFGVTELISELREGAKLLEATAPADRADLVTETTPTIAALLYKSLDLLDDATKDCYAYLGVFASKPATFDMNAMKYCWQIEDPKPVIGILVDRGLLEFVQELDRYQMHALLVMLAKSLLTDDD
jgi:hypothetical protein